MTSDLRILRVNAAAEALVKVAGLPEEIQNLDKAGVCSLQQVLGIGEKFGVVELPALWMPAGSRDRSKRTLDVRALLESLIPLPRREEAALALMRFAILLWMIPDPGRRGLPSPTTFIGLLRHALRMANRILQSPEAAQRPGVFSNFDYRHLDGLTESVAEDWLGLLRRMWQFQQRGLWADVPTYSRRWERGALPPIDPGDSVQPDQYQPFADDFVAAAGWRVCWLMDQLGPSIIDCALQVIMCMAFDTQGMKSRDQKRYKARQAERFLANYRWIVADGTALDELPFALDLLPNGAKSNVCWPPRNAVQMKRVLGLLQYCHLFIFLLSTGARISECLSIEPGQVELGADGPVANGRTFKLVFANGGDAKDWPLCERAARALEQQEELREVMLAWAEFGMAEPKRGRRPPSNGLWVRHTSGADLDVGYHALLRDWTKGLQLDELVDGRGIHSHRFRKTIARLAALALVGAPKILMDLFGHKTIEMTLTYILSHPQIRAEMLVVAKAQVIMETKGALAEAAQNGGPARIRIEEIVKHEQNRLGRLMADTDLNSLAESLTLGGQTWQMVRPGVLCIKNKFQPGACTRRSGAPDVAACRSKCEHRLERAYLREDVDLSLAHAVHMLRRAIDDEDEIMAEEWRGQILFNLARFPDLEVKWQADVEALGCRQSNREQKSADVERLFA